MFITIIIKRGHSSTGQSTMKTPHVSQVCRKLSVTLVLILLVSMLCRPSNLFGVAHVLPESERYVRNFVNMPLYGNWTFVEKPMFPVYFNHTRIPVGSNWTVVCPLIANHTYHVYCYGEWIDYGPSPSTDYDIYVYNPLGELEGYHTESAGLPEHLGTTTKEPFFVPEYSGNYTFVLRNDPRESRDSQQATFIVIENLECDIWHKHYIEGKKEELPTVGTSWGYQFVTESRYIEVLIKVPETLDMYEARLYLMANPQADKGSILNEVPLAWEAGLYGERQGMFGGYNLESEGYRGVAYASCEFHGQDMLMNFTSSHAGKSLYYLVLIGETGSGTTKFAVKTEFEDACLKPLILPREAYPDNDTVVAYISNSTDLKNGTLQYSTNGGKNLTSLEMEIANNRTCRTVIPGQGAGTFVNYKVEACDILENILVAYENYSVKHPSTLNLSQVTETSYLGENITIKGRLIPPAKNLPITVYFTSSNSSKQMVCYTLDNGTFTASFKPQTIGNWKIQAEFHEDRFRYGSTSPEFTVKVEEPPFWVKYSLYIGGGIGVMSIIGIIVYVKKSRE